METKRLDMYIPISLELDWPTKEHIVEEIREQHRLYGFTQFMLTCPCGGWRSVGYPPKSFYDEKATLFAEVQKALEQDGITLGWWMTATVKIGHDDALQPMINEDGSATIDSSCPLDENYRQRFAENAAAFCRIAHPAFIFTEDDFAIRASTGPNGCFCPLHLKAFAKRIGKEYTREELLAALTDGSEDAKRLNRAWRKLAKDSLIGLAKALRDGVDSVAPEIPIGYMEAGSAIIEDNACEDISRAMAGDRHIPFSRVCGTFYHGVKAGEIPNVLYHPLYQRQHIKPPFRFIHESDTYPHTRFYTSGLQMRAIMTSVYAYGYEGSVFQTQQLLDFGNEESAYGRMFAKEHRRFEALSALSQSGSLCGASLPSFPERSNGATPGWTRCLSHFGIPYTTCPAKIAFLDGAATPYLTDEEIVSQLSHGNAAFLDGDAARILCERGFSDYLGVNVTKEDAIKGLQLRDLGEREVIRDGFAQNSVGRNMPSAHMYAATNGNFYRMDVTDGACEVICEEYTFQKCYLCPTMTRFENRFGGRVVVMAMTVTGNYSQALYNYRRQKLFAEELAWCGADFIFAAENAPKLHLIDRKDGQSRYVTMLNLSEDTLDGIRLSLPEGLTVETVSVLTEDGTFSPIPFSANDRTLKLDEPIAFLQPMTIRIEAKTK